MFRHACHAQMLAAHMQVHTFDNQMHAPATQVHAFDNCMSMIKDVCQYMFAASIYKMQYSKMPDGCIDRRVHDCDVVLV